MKQIQLAVLVALISWSGCSDKPTTQMPADMATDASNADVSKPDLGPDAGEAPDANSVDVGPSSVSLANGNLSLDWSSADQTLALSRGDETVVEFPADGIQLGLVDEVNPELNYDPYGLFHVGQIPQDPPLREWSEPSKWEIAEATAERFTARLSFASGVEATLDAQVSAEGRFDLKLTPVTEVSQVALLRLSPRVTTDEAFYGLGEVFDDVNHRGHVRGMQIEVEQGVESFYNEAHVPIPLLVSSRGWGIFVHSFHPGVFDVAAQDEDRVHVVFGLAQDAAEGLTFHLMAEDHPLDITQHYYDLTGYPIEPARWALGPWIWRDENEDQAQVVSDVNTIRDLDLATTGYWIDRPYATGVNTFDFAADMFDDPQAMIDEMHDLGFRVALWHTPYLDESDDSTQALRDTANANGYYPLQNGPDLNNWGTLIDLSNPEAYAWWQDNIRRYTDMGIEGFKLDYGEDIVVGLGQTRIKWSFANGLDERTMQALYQHYYHGAYAELLPDTGGFLLCRRGTIGDQTRVSVIWPGDLDANMAVHKEEVTKDNGDTYKAVGGLPASLVAALSLGPAGYPLFGSDTGGYRHAPPNKETFVRWFQVTALSTVMQVGTNSNDVPWEFKDENGFDQESLDLYRDFARLHLRLFPYIWTYFQQLQRDGRPIQRALGLAYPELGVHPNDTYLLGDHLFVAPVVTPGAVTRTFTLPPGTWVNWWTGETLDGPGEFTVDAPLDTLPLYMAQDGFVPLLRPTIDTLAPVADPDRVDSYDTRAGRLHVRVAYGGTGSFEVFDGATLTTANSAGWTLSGTPGSEMSEGIVWEVLGAPADANFLLDGVSMTEVSDVAVESIGWQRDGALTYIAVPSGSHTVTIQ